MNNIGEILKRLREENGLKGNEVIEKLKEFGIEISVKTLYGYESGRNSTNADMFLALCQIYKCQNIMEVFSNSVDDILFTNKEWKIIEKYRDLDLHGKEMVDFTLSKEYERSIAEKVKQNNMVPITVKESTTYEINAAHADDYMGAPDELKKQEEDMMDSF